MTMNTILPFPADSAEFAEYDATMCELAEIAEREHPDPLPMDFAEYLKSERDAIRAERDRLMEFEEHAEQERQHEDMRELMRNMELECQYACEVHAWGL